jgi:sulfotransferase family protein
MISKTRLKGGLQNMQISPLEDIRRDVLNTKNSHRYLNPGTRLVFKRLFENQFSIPPPLPWYFKAIVKLYECSLLKVDVTDIKSEKPIFLIGLHRSGTTMLQDLVCSHPEVGFINNCMAYSPEHYCAVEQLRKILKMNSEGERILADSVKVTWDSPNEGILFWSKWLKEDPYSLEFNPKRLGDFKSEEIQGIHQSIKKILWCFEGRAQRFFSKNPRLLPHLDLLKALFPDGKFIHIIRDARTCANSLVKFYRLEQSQLELIRNRGGQNLFPEGPFISFARLPHLADYVQTYGPDSLETTSRLWNDALDWVRSIKDSIPNFYEVRYEDILANPREEMEKVLSFCELPPVPADHSPFWDQLQNIGKTHHTNRYGHFDLVESICRENLQRYGYL